MSDEKKMTSPDENETKKPLKPDETEPAKKPDEKQPEEEAVLYDASELSDDDLEGLSTEELEDKDGAGYFFVPVVVAANVNFVANINAGANLNVAANAMAAANAVAAANAMAAANVNALTNANVTD